MSGIAESKQRKTPKVASKSSRFSDFITLIAVDFATFVTIFGSLILIFQKEPIVLNGFPWPLSVPMTFHLLMAYPIAVIPADPRAWMRGWFGWCLTLGATFLPLVAFATIQDLPAFILTMLVLLSSSIDVVKEGSDWIAGVLAILVTLVYWSITGAV